MFYKNATCPARARGRWEGLQSASEATDGGSSWMGASSRSSMRGFLMFDSGLVRGVTLFRLSKLPGALLISCRVRNYQDDLDLRIKHLVGLRVTRF